MYTQVVEGVVDVKKPVVVFVRDQLTTDADRPRYSPGGASLTDSGRGNSDCGEEHSSNTPSTSSTSAKTSPRHDLNSESSVVSSPLLAASTALQC